VSEPYSDGVEFTALCKISDEKLAAIGYKFIPKKEEPLNKSKPPAKKKPQENGSTVEDPNEQEETEDENISRMMHEIHLFSPEQLTETKKKTEFFFKSTDRGSRP
jgi:hypothetical protein